MADGTAFRVGDRVWLLNMNGDPMMTGDTPTTRREIEFKIKAVHGERFELDSYNRDGRRYCGGSGHLAGALMRAD